MKRCLVLLCTYNGERFLREQLDSILAQEGVEVSVLAADDRSSDGTARILEDYAARDPRVRFIVNAENKGFARNFLDLVFAAREETFDFYALSDQDDVWMKDKLLTAAEALGGLTEWRGRGGLYCSNLTVTDAALRPLRLMEDESVKRASGKTFPFENIATGCTVVFDREFLLHATSYRPAEIPLHDYWLFLIAAYTADYCYDFSSHILYRQHGDNLIGGSGGKFTLKNIARVLRGKGEHARLAGEFLKGFSNFLRPEDRRRLEAVRDYRKKLSCRLAVLRMKGRTGRKTLFLRAKVLLGKL